MSYVIRTSDRKTFKQCRQLWHFTSPLRLEYESVRSNENLEFGIAVHKGLEDYYNPETWSFPQHIREANALSAFIEANNYQKKLLAFSRGELSIEDEQEYAEREELGVGMLKNYFRWAPEHDRFKPVAVEEAIQVPVRTPEGTELEIDGQPVLYQVRIDLLVEDESGDLWIVDHKTASRFDSLSFLEVDTQLSSYAWAAQQHYYKPIAGVVYNELRKSVPQPPRVLSSGQLSKDKRQSTTYEMYLSELDRQGLDPADYSDILDYLRVAGDSYFRRTQVHRSQAQLQVQGRIIFEEAVDMLSDPSIYPNPNKFNCNSCGFYAPCVVECEQGDVDFVLRDPKLYRKRQPW